jgi:hypothetical protein
LAHPEILEELLEPLVSLVYLAHQETKAPPALQDRQGQQVLQVQRAPLVWQDRQELMVQMARLEHLVQLVT